MSRERPTGRYYTHKRTIEEKPQHIKLVNVHALNFNTLLDDVRKSPLPQDVIANSNGWERLSKHFLSGKNPHGSQDRPFYTVTKAGS
jgi:hypothetical protein